MLRLYGYLYFPVFISVFLHPSIYWSFEYSDTHVLTRAKRVF